jgi:SAM-dependent methyltransferase
LLDIAFQLLYSRLSCVHEFAGRAVFGPAWSARRLLTVADGALHGPIVDIGCGEGRLLADHGWGVDIRFGVDPSQQATRRARQRGALVVRGTAQRLPIRSASVGQIICSYPGPWIMERAVWDEFARVLSPGGSLAILLGGVTLRGRGVRVRQMAQRVVYGKSRDDDASDIPQLPGDFEHPAIPGTIERLDDEWGYAYVWRGSRVERGPRN